MDIDEIRQKMLDYYENAAFVEKWLNSPNIVFRGMTPTELFSMDNRVAVATKNGFVKFLEKLNSQK